jgi:hypothetical protein
MPELKDFAPLNTVWQIAGVKRTTLYSAVKRREIRAYVMGDKSTVVVRIADVIRWKDKERKRGPKPKK